MTSLNRPENKRIINPATGTMELEWIGYFARLESVINALGAAGVISFEGRNGVVVGAAGDYTAAEIANTPAGGIAAITVQAALDELDGDKVATSRQIISGAGLSGGGALTADRTLIIGAGTGITVGADDVGLDTASERNVDHSGVSITAGAGLTGGGTISASRTLDVGAGTGITVNADNVALDTTHARNVDHSAVSVVAGNGLTGGGTIDATRTLDVGAGTGITVAADSVGIAAGGVDTTQLADNGVTMAKLADASAWTLLMRNNAASGDPAYTKISALTDSGGFGVGDKLIIEESTGELRKIDYSNLPGAGGTGPVAVVASGAISAAATLDLVLGSADMYEIDLIDFLPATDNQQLSARFSQSGTFLAAAGDYDFGFFTFSARVTSGASPSAATQISMANQWGNQALEIGSFTIRIFRPSVGSFRKSLIFQGGHHSTTGEPLFTAGHGTLLNNTNAIDGVRFRFDSGNIASGYYAMRSYSFT